MPTGSGNNLNSNNLINEADTGSNNTNPEYSLDFLIKLIPDNFDGDRYKIRSFIKQVDGVFELAKPNQKTPLILFIKSKITGKAREQIDIHCNLTSWEEISELLINLYQDKKTIDQLLEELNNTKQEHNENVSQFYQRLEDVSSRILAIIHSSESNTINLKGRLLMINDITLNRFIYHSHPQISQMLRYREFQTINNALTAAIAEEKTLKLTYKGNNNFQKCKICGRSNHTTNNCFKNINRQKNHVVSKSINYSQTSKNQPTKQCNYCKKSGHTINECYKRQYNNTRKQNQQNPTGTNTPSASNTNQRNTQSVNFQQQNFQIRDHPPNPPEIDQVTQDFNNFLI